MVYKKQVGQLISKSTGICKRGAENNIWLLDIINKYTRMSVSHRTHGISGLT